MTKIKKHTVEVYIVEGRSRLEEVDLSEEFENGVVHGYAIGLLFCDTAHKAYDDGWLMVYPECDFKNMYDSELSCYDEIYAYCEEGQSHRAVVLIEALRTTHHRSGVETQANIHFVKK